MRNANYIAFDFETAAVTSRMPCQIGVAVVAAGEITETYSSLIKPPGNRYSSKLIDCHGITPDITKNAPEFPEVWGEVLALFKANFIVAHNLSFDLDVLHRAAKFYGLKVPIFMGEACTYQLTRLGLKDCCAAFNIPLETHHDAACDAVACAKIFLKYLSGETLHRAIEVESRTPKYNTQLKGRILGMDLTDADPNHPLYKKQLAITGTFSKWDRYELADSLKKKGADLKSGVTSKIDFVAVGEGAGFRKLEKIKELRDSGRNVIILNEKDIEHLLNI